MRKATMGRQNQRKQIHHDDGDGWERWGGYMAAKRAKLDQQFHFQNKNDNSTSSADNLLSQIFRGISIYINGYTNPPEPELRCIFTRHGGTYTSYLSASTTFVIASNLPMGKKKLLAGKTLKADWIVDSVKAGKKLDHRMYMLYNLNAENKQITLSQLFKKSNTNEIIQIPNNPEDDITCINSEEIDCVDMIEHTSSVDMIEHTTTNQNEEEQNLSSSSSSLELQSLIISSPDTSITNNISPPSLVVTETSLINLENKKQNNCDTNLLNKLKTAGEDGFLQDFYNNSRLHLISTMKKEIQLMVSEWRKNSSTHKFPLLYDYSDSIPLGGEISIDDDDLSQILFHVDLDCFFVAVGRLTRPHLMNKPIVVTHSKGNNSKIDSRSDISCASYEARAKGVKAGMWLHQAKKLCPEIEPIPYEFDEYKKVSKIFFETVGRLTLEMEPISIDEMVIDVTEILKNTSSNPTTLARFLRKAIQDETNINASIGIGSNKLTAKLATRKAKDKGTGHYFMRASQVKGYIREQSVRKLPGIGWATADRLATQFNVETGSQLEALSLEELKKAFGGKIGEKLHSICRGIDLDTINCESVNAKSLSAGCSWGVRFTKYEELEKFIRDLSLEISQRATKSKCFGSKLSLSLWIVKKGYINVTVKPGGHGVVDISTRTRKFLQHTRETPLIASTALELARSITKTSIPPDHIRGVSISIDGLRYESDISAKEKKIVQTTLFSSNANKGTWLSSRCSDDLSTSNATSSSRTSIDPVSPSRKSVHGILVSPLPIKRKDEIEKQMKILSASICQVNQTHIPIPLQTRKEEVGVTHLMDPVVLLEKLKSGANGKEKSYDKEVGYRKYQSGNHIEKNLPMLNSGHKNQNDNPVQQSRVETLKSNDTVEEVTIVIDEPNTSDKKIVSKLVELEISPPQEVLETVEIELDIFTGDVLQIPPAQHDALCVVETDCHMSPNNKNKPSIDSKKTTNINCSEKNRDINSKTNVQAGIGTSTSSTSSQNNLNVIISNTENQKVNSPDSLQPLESHNIEDIKMKEPKYFELLPIRGSACSKSKEILNEYDPIVQQKILDSFKKPCKLPFLNGASDIRKVHSIIRNGSTGRMPNDVDIDCLETYFKDLTPFLKQACLSLKFLMKWKIKLELEKGESNNAWVNVFEKIISQTEATIEEKYGGHIEIHSPSYGGVGVWNFQVE